MTIQNGSDPSKILYVVALTPDQGYEDKFNEWYDHEHLPELLACPGFESATRLSKVEGTDEAPQYLAFYSMADMAAFRGEEYQRLSARSLDDLSPLAREVKTHRTLNMSAKYREILFRGQN